MTWDELMKKVDDGRFFSVTFRKRTTGEVRKMVCRIGVKRYLAGGESAYDFRRKNLLPVWDVNEEKRLMREGLDKFSAGRKSYRCIPVENILDIKGVRE